MNSKKLLVFSDSHGSVLGLKYVFSWAKKYIPPDGTICAAAFCGDGLSDLQIAATQTGFFTDWKLVRGNNDYDHSIPQTIVFDFNDFRFFMCHGHRYNLYSGYYSLINAARENNANVVLFGHTHVPFQKKADGILLVNPGSVGRARSKIGESFAVIECTCGEAPKVEFFSIGKRGEIGKIEVSVSSN